MTVGDNIRLLRKSVGLSQAKLADKLYVTPQAVSRWENNETEPDIDTLQKLADIFNVSVEEIIRGGEALAKGIRAEQVYHFLCLVGGCFTTIFAVIFIALMIVNGRSSTLEIIYVSVSLLFLFSILFFEIRSRILNRNRKKLKKGVKENENLKKD